ncbi:MAG TPA: MBL fold metallo-hydrolase [Streptomyces sp.]|nr:MBL fold metallo-hydrolase [Streptomyces sp.]
MDLVELKPWLHLLRFPVGQAYLWRDGDALTLIDSGPPGAADDVEGAIGTLGLQPSALRRIVLTHFHADHSGAAGELATRHSVPVLAHHADAPVIRGELPPPPPDFSDAPDWERRLFDQIHAGYGISSEDPRPIPAPPVHVDHELRGGDTLDLGGGGLGGGGLVVAVPGHTDGSIAVQLPLHRALFTGDAVAAGGEDGTAMLGVFNADRGRAISSLERLAELPVDAAYFGHGGPVTRDAAGALRQAAALFVEPSAGGR